MSASYLASDHLHDRELSFALGRAHAEDAVVLPVLCRSYDQGSVSLEGMISLPQNRVPVANWPDRDAAWADVVRGIREAISNPGAARETVARAKQAVTMRVTQDSALVPRYEDAESRALVERIEAASARRRLLSSTGMSTDSLDHEILDLRRRLRSGGRLRAGDALEDHRYLLLEQIGRGGFASVWAALDRGRGERVAIKVLHPDLAREPSQRERFFRGARVMAEFVHPAVVRVLSPHGEDGGYFYFVMELIEGEDLQHAVVGGRLPKADVVPLILRVGEALGEAHAKGIVHRDVKPGNILLDASGAPRLTDFDLVAAKDTTGGTRTGAMGTFLFTAPEQIRMAKEADARADVYALGMTAIFCLHGSDLPVIAVRNPDKVIAALPCDDTIKEVLTQAIEVQPGKRFADARALCEALRETTFNTQHSGSLAAQRPKLLSKTVLRFEVSRSEEQIYLSLVCDDEVTPLGSRSHNEVLLVLARARLQDQRAGLPPGEQGWRYVDELLGMLNIQLEHLNVILFRARRHLAKAGVVDTGVLFERRATTRQIRLGTDAFDIIAL